MSTFLQDLEAVINQHSLGNDSDTPDFILAAYLADCLRAWNAAVQKRSQWYGLEVHRLRKRRQPRTPRPQLPIL